MKHLYVLLFACLCAILATAQPALYQQNRTIEYADLIKAYQKLDEVSDQVMMTKYGETDAGYPVHLVVVGKGAHSKNFAKRKGAVLLIMNGIHPGESEGIDASLEMVQDIVSGKMKLHDSVTLCIIPVYNVEGMLNRRKYTRMNQDGPIEKGFRGTARNFDLNRDFMKADAKNTFAFYKLFHDWDPDVFIDNHTSNGADYQYTMTLITTQRQKLGGAAASFLHESMKPALYADMLAKGQEMTPYVHLFGKAPDEGGFEEFVESPRYSTGFTSLFGTLGFVAETHMLKPYPARVKATRQLMESMIAFTGAHAGEIHSVRAEDKDIYNALKKYPTNYRIDTAVSTSLAFKGYEVTRENSSLGNYQRMLYDRNRPYTKNIPYFNYAVPGAEISVPKSFVIPAGWNEMIARLKANQVSMRTFSQDTFLMVTSCYIDAYSSSPPYEGHHVNSRIKMRTTLSKMRFAKGDVIVHTSQPGCRYIMEALSPEAEDGFFAWNFFDGILNMKEGFSDYAFEDDAMKLVNESPEMRKRLEDWKAANPDKAKSSWETLLFIYKNSHYYEPEHNRLPVYRVELE
jgi:hypothetical protein